MPQFTTQAERNYEALEANPKALPMLPVRRAVLERITDHAGIISWSKAHLIAVSFPSNMAAQTVINFAMGETKKPDIYTWTKLTEYVNDDLPIDESEVWLLPSGSRPKVGVRIK